jgi:hypothetical protein
VIASRSLKDSIIVSIIFLMGFQAFPIIKLGGTFKTYELLSILLVIIELIYVKRFKFANSLALVAFALFVFSPIISYLYSNLFLGYPTGFYNYYPYVSSFKFNYFIFPALLLVYMFFNFFVFNYVIISSYVYLNLKNILKYSVIIGSLIAIYSLFSMFFGDVVLRLPSFIQNKTEYPFRSYGFSQEPSFYILYQGWICLFTWYTRHLFSKKVWCFLIMLNMAALVLSLSTMIAAFLGIILSSAFIFKSSFKKRTWIIFSLLLLLLAGYFIMMYFNLSGLFEYVFTSKLEGFFTAPEFTFTSGGIRRYTSQLGIEIFKDHWLTGVGVGNSIYYMYIYDYLKMDNVVVAGTFPQNAFSCVLSEQGIIGGGLFFVFLLLIIRKFWINRNKSEYNQMFLLGTLFNIVCLLSIVPIYSLYMWVFIGLGLNYVKNFNVRDIVGCQS